MLPCWHESHDDVLIPENVAIDADQSDSAMWFLLANRLASVYNAVKISKSSSIDSCTANAATLELVAGDDEGWAAVLACAFKQTSNERSCDA